MYKTTAMTKGYGSPNPGSAKQASLKYGPPMGMTLLKARMNNESGNAVDNVILSLGPFAQKSGLREANVTQNGVYRRNPIDQRKALSSSVILSGVGLAGAYAAFQAANDRNWLRAAIYGATSVAGLAAMPNWELRL